MMGNEEHTPRPSESSNSVCHRCNVKNIDSRPVAENAQAISANTLTLEKCASTSLLKKKESNNDYEAKKITQTHAHAQLQSAASAAQ